MLTSFDFVKAQDWECDLLEKGNELYDQGKKDSAIIVWKTVVNNYPDTSNCYGRSYNNIPIVYSDMGNKEEAVKWYKKILESSLDDSEEGDNLMAPYANYKHNACLRLADLYKNENEIENSFKYIKLAETEFIYQTFSATSFEKRAVLIAFRKAELYQLQGKDKDALFVMLEKILDVDVFFRKTDAASFSSVDFYSGLIKAVGPMIEKEYGIANFKKKLKKSIKRISVNEVKIGLEQSDAKLGTFIFDGREFNIGVSDNDYSKKEFKKLLLANRIFNEI